MRFPGAYCEIEVMGAAQRGNGDEAAHPADRHNQGKKEYLFHAPKMISLPDDPRGQFPYNK
jgi:hypothetical protein